MKKLLMIGVVVLAVSSFVTCATIISGKIDSCTRLWILSV
jgi:hypothetical protein